MTEKTFDQAVALLADALADVLSHKDCPAALARSIETWFTEFEADLQPVIELADEAEHIRQTLPSLARIAARKGGAE